MAEAPARQCRGTVGSGAGYGGHKPPILTLPDIIKRNIIQRTIRRY